MNILMFVGILIVIVVIVKNIFILVFVFIVKKWCIYVKYDRMLIIIIEKIIDL